jgi:hypothetical protein
MFFTNITGSHKCCMSKYVYCLSVGVLCDFSVWNLILKDFRVHICLFGRTIRT